jgi:hypothetical protein
VKIKMLLLQKCRLDDVDIDETLVHTVVTALFGHAKVPVWHSPFYTLNRHIHNPKIS